METISLVIPIYNESNRLSNTLKALTSPWLSTGLKLEKIIFVNDGSTDNTRKHIIANKKALEKMLNCDVELIAYKNNKGKGFAVRTGMLASNSKYTLFMDADMSTPLTEIKKLVPFMNIGLDVIIGTRKNGKSTVVKHQPLYRELLGKGFTLLSQLILNTWVTDFTCGFKVFSKKANLDIFGKARIERWGYDSELMFIANKLGYKIKEVPVVWSNDERTKVNLFKALPQSLLELFTIRYFEFQGKYNPSYGFSPAPGIRSSFNTLVARVFTK